MVIAGSLLIAGQEWQPARLWHLGAESYTHHPRPRNAWSPVAIARRFFDVPKLKHRPCSPGRHVPTPRVSMTAGADPWCSNTPKSYVLSLQDITIITSQLVQPETTAHWTELNDVEPPHHTPQTGHRGSRLLSPTLALCAECFATPLPGGAAVLMHHQHPRTLGDLSLKIDSTRCLAIFWGRWTNRWNQGPSFQTDLIVNIDSGCGPAFLFSLAFWACQCRSFRPIDVPEKRSG